MVHRPPIGRVIREARLALGYTQAKLASLCDITPQYLSLLELGEVNVSFDTLLSISAALDQPLSSMIEKAETLHAGSQVSESTAKSHERTRSKTARAVIKRAKKL
ncbi:helix-turn-helix domain-containing protein [Paraburkholderia azotifigens]|uniref:Helix-turn-helix transcriptional regulator n=1 Tax=Paraburkholderia azotifigens TaxID=2057004 RepID=A0A5C6V2M6_9BURK|nr:helix-turn-helix transcriptional regulator [Paraburkholderia azotifigens]